MDISCLKCSLPINSNELILSCEFCTETAHTTCLFSSGGISQNSAKQWLCQSCESLKQCHQKSSKEGYSYSWMISKLDDHLVELQNLYKEQNNILQTVVGLCNDDVVECRKIFENFNVSLSSMKSRATLMYDKALTDLEADKSVQIEDIDLPTSSLTQETYNTV